MRLALIAGLVLLQAPVASAHTDPVGGLVLVYCEKNRPSDWLDHFDECVDALVREYSKACKDRPVDLGAAQRTSFKGCEILRKESCPTAKADSRSWDDCVAAGAEESTRSCREAAKDHLFALHCQLAEQLRKK